MSQEEKIFKGTLQMLVLMVVAKMHEYYGVEPLEAVKELYASRLYSDLERETSKLWHLSPLALADLWHQEITTGEITYPEEA